MLPVDLTHLANGELLVFAAPAALLLLMLWLLRRDEDK